ncbi:MAG: YkgJ family cysteine cluster protein [bacterium]|nr:YkgJ family cysteine cluster protein [bacterium]
MNSGNIGKNVPASVRRACGSCSLCCTVLRVDELHKLGGTPCPQLSTSGGGCGIHPTRPPICRAYRCLWLQGGLEEDDRPDRLAAVTDLLSEGGTTRLAIREAYPGAFDRTPRLQEIAGRFRQTMPVRVSSTRDVLDPDAPYRMLLPNGDTHDVNGEWTRVTRADGQTERLRLPWMERGVRKLLVAIRRFRQRGSLPRD